MLGLKGGLAFLQLLQQALVGSERYLLGGVLHESSSWIEIQHQDRNKQLSESTYFLYDAWMQK